MSLLGLFIGIGTHFKCRTTRSGGSSVETEGDYRVLAFLSYLTNLDFGVVLAILSTTTPGLIKLMQGGTWDKARCFELTQDTLQKMKALEVVDD
ncbi:hypothetical protein D9758_017701 [Tetrapyrgos nigripes]|uniref:Uncharacterized protein n=1 Tax=Tetrapyrgos nigripes TaxID=182062 RepID=A0A8H5FHI0_9AGAR|nr:hypothetical protein D9758_017701 [Tetrapyrgos nigripes]